MKVEVFERNIFYDFTKDEVNFLQSFAVWELLRSNLKEHERILIEGQADYAL